jgi:hypothetical protein
MRTTVIEILLLVAVGCSEKLTQPPIVALRHDEASSGDPSPDAGHVVPKPECIGYCCPHESECYPPATPDPHSGPECLAQRENTGQKHWQFRQTLSVSSNPPGIAIPQVANILALRSELMWPECYTPNGPSGFIQLIDVDREHDTARVGFARYVDDAKTALSQGLCFVEDTYDDPKWALPPVPPSAGWPVGLPPPLSLPFPVKPVTAVRYRDAKGNFADFDLKTDRKAILERLDPVSGDLKKYGGIYFLDEKAGVMHGYAPVVYILNYDTKTQYNAIPIRESEIRTQLNDPLYPNCAGVYLGTNPNADCTGNATTRSWGCAPGSCGDQAAGPTTVDGYFLVTELEQIYNPLLGTLCHVFPGPELYPGWNLANETSCRADSVHWDLRNPLVGVPPGDWCAATNTKASPDCHDAWRSVSSATFQAFPIQEGTCPAK